MSLRSLAPGLILAAPRLGDPNFEKSVVLLGRHEPQGALGWVINGEECGVVRTLLQNSKLKDPAIELPRTASFDTIARRGGPVTPGSGWLLYRKETAPHEVSGEITIGASLSMTGDVDAFREVLSGGAPREFKLYLGYAGWGPMQLEREVQEGAWLPCPLDLDLLYDTPTDELWDAAYRRAIGASPGAFVRGRGSA